MYTPFAGLTSIFNMQNLPGTSPRIFAARVKYCILDEEAKQILEKARLNYQLSFRSINKVLKVSRTIADLNDNEIITKNDILKSLNFRRR